MNSILIFNIDWMLFNIWLAIVPVIFVWLFFAVKNRILKWIFGILWLLYLPNTIYIITDMEHIFTQWPRVDEASRLILVLQYIVLEFVGIVTFFIALCPLETLLTTWKPTKTAATGILITFNMLMGFAMVLGKVERIHSWYVFTQPLHVLRSIEQVLSSGELVILALLLGVFTNCLYFLFRKPLVKMFTR